MIRHSTPSQGISFLLFLSLFSLPLAIVYFTQPVQAEEVHPEYGTIVGIGMSQAFVALSRPRPLTIFFQQIWEQGAHTCLAVYDFLTSICCHLVIQYSTPSLSVPYLTSDEFEELNTDLFQENHEARARQAGLEGRRREEGGY